MTNANLEIIREVLTAELAKVVAHTVTPEGVVDMGYKYEAIANNTSIPDDERILYRAFVRALANAAMLTHTNKENLDITAIGIVRMKDPMQQTIALGRLANSNGLSDEDFQYISTYISKHM